MPTLDYQPQYEQPRARSGPRVINGVRLRPGKNNLTTEQWNLIKGDDLIKDLQEWNALKTVAASEEPDSDNADAKQKTTKPVEKQTIADK